MSTPAIAVVVDDRREYSVGASTYCKYTVKDGKPLWSCESHLERQSTYDLDNLIASLQAMRADLEKEQTPTPKTRPLSARDRKPEIGDALFFVYRKDALRVVKSYNGRSFVSEDGSDWLWCDPNLIYAFRKDGGPLTTTKAPE